jgi:hypothetical protein
LAEDPLGLRLVAVLVEVVLPVLRGRVLDAPPRPVLPDLDEDVLLLRDPGGEDVRVAMPTT